jgi:hypothetical protein
MYSVYQHWDPLQVCVVGRSYPPEFYSWIQNSETRNRFETLAIETEQDFQKLASKLSDFGVAVIRPQIPDNFDQLHIDNYWVQPPVTPRDYFIMVHDKLWVPAHPNQHHAQRIGADAVLDQAQHNIKLSMYTNIFDHVRAQGNAVCSTDLDVVSGCFVSRIGQDLYFATQSYEQDQSQLLSQVNRLFPTTHNRVVNAGGHGDATYCPVTPGLIISLRDVPTYADTFPEWEVVYLPPSNYAHMSEFQSSMRINRGRWFMPGFEQDTNLQHLVEHYFDSWVGNVSETVFDVNILVLDEHNIVVSAHNNAVESACARHGVEVHVVPFRHKYFWDAGMHCITNDLSRMGTLKNYFAHDTYK